jgi:Peptidase A4 family
MRKTNLAVVFATLISIYPVTKAAGQTAANSVPTNRPGATTSISPPEGFNPIDASDEELATYGFPPRPDAQADPNANAAWQKAMLASKHRIAPQLELTNIFHGPARAPGSVTNTNTTSSNWSGSVDLTGASSYNKTSSAYYIIAEYVVPVARQAYGACTGSWDYSSSWVGMDGWGSGDVLQAGTESDAFCWIFGSSTYYSAWYEWYPYGSVRISNFPIAPGDDMFVEVWNTSATQGYAYLVNYNTDQTVEVGFAAPSSAHFIGNSFEWVVERPTVGGSLATLTNYISDYFSDCYGVTWGGTRYTPSTSSALQVWMNDNNGHPISYPYPMGTYGVWLQDEGSAR